MTVPHFKAESTAGHDLNAIEVTRGQTLTQAVRRIFEDRRTLQSTLKKVILFDGRGFKIHDSTRLAGCTHRLHDTVRQSVRIKKPTLGDSWNGKLKFKLINSLIARVLGICLVANRTEFVLAQKRVKQLVQHRRSQVWSAIDIVRDCAGLGKFTYQALTNVIIAKR